jgi:hypothetical protein
MMGYAKSLLKLYEVFSVQNSSLALYKSGINPDLFIGSWL